MSGTAFDPAAMLAEPRQRRRSSVDGFWSLVDKSCPEDCWVWTKRRHRDGYGLLTWCGRDAQAHRVAYGLTHGPIPDGLLVMHACDNPPCCNPSHLRLGTYADNRADMVAKGRGRSNPVRGARNCNAKLNDDLVRELRAAWHAGESLKSIAKRTGLAVGTVHPMLHGRTWAHVED